MINLNLSSENNYEQWELDEKEVLENAKKIFNYYMQLPEIAENCCLKKFEYKTIAFDFLFCDSKMTHEINRDYRNKDYPADIITFAVFADSPDEERFVLDMEINLGEVIISLDKIIDEAANKNIDRETELNFLISHGILHLLGFDHQTEEEFNFVVSHQKEALKSIGIVYDKI